MPRLRSRTKWPPGEFQILLPEIGMKRPIKGSFSEVVNAFAKIVEANPALADKHGWPRDREGQENWLDEREAHRLIANGYLNFVDLEGDPPKAGRAGVRPPASAAAVAGNAKTALSIYKDLFGGERPVERDLAEARAKVCAVCPLNDISKSLTHYFTEKLAKSLTSLWGMMNDLSLNTSQDAALGVCQACECPMRAKVHVPLKVLDTHMTRDQFDKLDPACWIRAEVNDELLDH